jgi:alkaline phosphatase
MSILQIRKGKQNEIYRIYGRNKKQACRSLYFLLNFLFFLFLLISGTNEAYGQDHAKYIILMIADGWSANDIEATKKYCQSSGSCSSIPPYEQWTKYFMSTYYDGNGCGYDPNQAWSTFDYVKTGCITDSAAAATALYTGSKTQVGRISVSSDGNRLGTIEEKARAFGMASGAITTVEVTDATPGAWVAHNDNRTNHYAIGDEGFLGDPNTTGLPSTPGYAGGHGSTLPTADVLIGDGRSTYVSDAIKNKLRTESGQPGKHFLVERKTGVDGGEALLNAANDPNVTKLAGLFDQIYRMADGSGYNPENPTLSESAEAALAVLSKNPNGFVLMIEGGAIDWGAHANNLNYVAGEMIDFNNAVQAVINWIEDTNNGSNWDNTLLIITGDHETGYLTAAPDVFPDEPLGAVTSSTLSKEKINNNTGFRASWEDSNGNGYIDPGETVYWSWNSSDHTNGLIPLYVKGVGAELFANYIVGQDPIRGYYIDNIDVFNVMNSVLGDLGAPISAVTIPVNGSIINSATANPYTISGTATDNVAVQSIELSTNGGTTWNATICTGCPGANVTWTYSWILPVDGNYTIKSRATDTSNNVETPGAGNTVTIDRTKPSISITVPANGATGVALNSDVMITFSENIDCGTVNTTDITSDSPSWTLNTCSTNQAVFHTNGQTGSTIYHVNVSIAVKDLAGNPMSAAYAFSYTTIDTLAPVVTAFTVPVTSKSLNIPITTFTVTDNVAVTGYMITTTATRPLAGDEGWTATAPATYTVASDGTYTLYPWAKDAASNISAVFATPRTVIVDTVAPYIAVKLVSPNGGDTIPSGSKYTISWGAPPEAVKFKLLLSLDNGLTWFPIPKTADFIKSTSYDWAVPKPWGNKKKCLVKVMGYKANGVNVGADKSDAPFMIEVVKLTDPNEEGTLTCGVPNTITWTTNTTKRDVAKVKLYYTKNNGLTWIPIIALTDPAYLATGSHSYDQWIPTCNKPKDNCCKLRVELKDADGNILGTDASDGWLTIQPAPTP